MTDHSEASPEPPRFKNIKDISYKGGKDTKLGKETPKEKPQEVKLKAPVSEVEVLKEIIKEDIVTVEEYTNKDDSLKPAQSFKKIDTLQKKELAKYSDTNANKATDKADTSYTKEATEKNDQVDTEKDNQANHHLDEIENLIREVEESFRGDKSGDLDSINSKLSHIDKGHLSKKTLKRIDSLQNLVEDRIRQLDSQPVPALA